MESCVVKFSRKRRRQRERGKGIEREREKKKRGGGADRDVNRQQGPIDRNTKRLRLREKIDC